MSRARKLLSHFSALLLLVAVATDAAAADPPRASEPSSGRTPSRPGFQRGSGSLEHEAEAHAIAVPTPENARKLLRTLTAEPHVAGTPADYKTAVFVRDKLREWGWKADLAEMEVLLNYPAASSRRSLSIDRPSQSALARRSTGRH